MELVVYKGFSVKKINQMGLNPLYDNNINDKFNILNYDNKYYQSLLKNLTFMEEDKYITYEEFVFLCKKDGGITLNNMLTTFDIKLKIIYNNIYPEIYPCYLNDKKLLDEFINQNDIGNKEPINEQLQLANIYNKVYYISGHYYVAYHNVEYDIENVVKENKYDDTPKDIVETKEPQVVYEISESAEDYILKLHEITVNNYENIGIKLMGESERVYDLYRNFCAFLNTNDKYSLTKYESYEKNDSLTNSFKKIVTNILKVPDFQNFRDLDFYENPSLSNKLIKINQAQIMSDMVEQALNAKKCEDLVIETNGKKMSPYRDIFVTAPTGAGKSLMFQIPAIYLAEKNNLLTIIITPLIELMNDQVRNLHERGYLAAERLNASINPIDKKKIVKNISEGNKFIIFSS